MFYKPCDAFRRSLTILNDNDEDETEELDTFNGNGFLSIGGDYFNRRGGEINNISNEGELMQEENSGPYDLRYQNTFASLPVDQSHYTTSPHTKVYLLVYMHI